MYKFSQTLLHYNDLSQVILEVFRLLYVYNLIVISKDVEQDVQKRWHCQLSPYGFCYSK